VIKAIIFDCFGVIVTDPFELLLQASFPDDPVAADQIKAYDRAAAKGQITSDAAQKEIASALGISIAEYRELDRSSFVIDYELLEDLLLLKQSHKIGMLSNTSLRSLGSYFKADKLSTCFDSVAASDDIGVAKPAAEAYQIVAHSLGVLCEEAAMIDDRMSHCEGARAAGMKAIHYYSRSQLKASLASLL
jgi:HAD superfamily hydrolase (TIGR01509 family)